MKQIYAALGLIFNNKGEVLLGQRTLDRRYGGYWEFPGGKIEPEEVNSPEQTIIRELSEELGIDVTQTHYLGAIEHEYPDFTVKLEAFKIVSYTGEPYGKEGQEITWLPPEKINTLEPKLLAASYEILGLLG